MTLNSNHDDKTPNDNRFGLWLRQRRIHFDLTQEQLADRIGCSPETVRKIEAGRRRPSRQMVEVLGGYLKVPAEEMDDLVRLARIAEDRDDLQIPAWAGDMVPSAVPQPMATIAPKSNIPAWRTPFIGREKERADVARLLLDGSARLLTLIGPAGIGKTRLSFQVAADLIDNFTDGVFYVPLSPVRDAAEVGPAIVHTLNVKESPGHSLDETLQDFLRDKHMLLVLDNFEQVVDARPLLGQLLAEAPRLSVFVTSRTALNIYGEHQYPLPPMSLPDAADRPSFEQIAQSEAVDLFAQRARAVKPDFTLSPANAPVIAEICRQLDALPLAIELAAVRIKVLTPEALLARLGSRLGLLTRGSQDLPKRQQTLRDAIDWSYDLLDDDEKALYRRISVFLGAVALEAIEGVVATSDLHPMMADTFDLVASLADQSMVRHTTAYGEPRFWMLWTLREYGLEKLAQAGEEQGVKAAHARYFLGLAERAEPMLKGPEQAAWLNRLENDHPNLRAALEWGRDHDPETLARLAAALWRFWYVRGYLSEGRQWCETALSLGDKTSPATRAWIGFGAGALATNQGDFAQARTLLLQSLADFQEQDDQTGIANVLDSLGILACQQADYAEAKTFFDKSLKLRRELGNERNIAGSLNNLARVMTAQGKYEDARKLLEEGIAVTRRLGNKEITAISLNNLGHVIRYLGDYTNALAMYEESLSLKRELGDKVGIASSLNSLGEIARHEGNVTLAQRLFGESQAIYRELGDKESLTVVLNNLGHSARNTGDYESARTYYQESLQLLRQVGDKQGMAICLIGLADVAHSDGELKHAAFLIASAKGLLDAIGVALDPATHGEYDKISSAISAMIGESPLNQTHKAASALPLQQMLNEALRISYSHQVGVPNKASR